MRDGPTLRSKVEARNLVKVYDFDGTSNVEYSESFSTTEGLHRYWKLPSTVTLTGEDGIGASGDDGHTVETNAPNVIGFWVNGIYLSVKVTTLFGFDFNYLNGKETSYSKGAGSTLACSRMSNLNVATPILTL